MIFLAGAKIIQKDDDRDPAVCAMLSPGKGANMNSIIRLNGFVLGVLSIGLLSSTLAIQAMSQELPKVYDASMPRDQQIALAESAAPAEVSSKATVYVLGPKGYEKAREGTNGFSCFVGRHFAKPTETTIEPTCFDAEGSRTLLLVYLHGEELRTAGKSETEIKADIENGYKAGRYEHPSKPGFLYMMSSENRLGPTPDHGTATFPPHLMFYAPNMTTKDIGFATQPKLDYLGMTHPGAGDNLIVVIPMASTKPASPVDR
jgi:hypothetical protein